MAKLVDKVSSLCTRRAVVYKSGEQFLYGPLGVGLRRHFRDLWWQSCVTSQDSIFGLELPPADNFRNEPTQDREILNSFHQLRTLVKSELPIGIATSTTVASSPDSKIPIFGELCPEELSVYQLVPCNHVTKWMDHWQSVRLRWWRELSTGPSKFTLRQVKSNNGSLNNNNKSSNNNNSNNDNINNNGNSNDHRRVNGVRSCLVEYAFPWATEAVDVISNHGKWEVNGVGTDGTLLEVRTSVNHGLLAYIIDAFQEKHGETVLAIDPKLAPYKLAVADCSSLPEKTVREVMLYVTQELRDAGVPVLNLGQIAEDEAERIYDEMGVPYTLILTTHMLENGILHLRSRDTTLKEDVHITSVKEKVLKYTRGAAV